MTDASNPCVLLTGFEPFAGDGVNPSWEVARALDGWACEGATVRALQLPCVFGLAAERLDQALAEWRPRLAVCLGLGTGRIEVSLERAALNVDDARIPDNAGRQPIDTPVVAGGPAGYFSTLPIKAMLRDLRAAGLPATVSNTAGTFVCNHAFYALMHALATRPALSRTRGGFIHLPCLPQQAAALANTPSMALATQVEALRVALRTALTVHEDVRESAGRLH